MIALLFLLPALALLVPVSWAPGLIVAILVGLALWVALVAAVQAWEPDGPRPLTLAERLHPPVTTPAPDPVWLAAWLAEDSDDLSWVGGARLRITLARIRHDVEGPRWTPAAPLVPDRRRWVARPAGRALEAVAS